VAHELPLVGCWAEGLLMFVHLATFRVTRHDSALKRQQRIPASVSGNKMKKLIFYILLIFVAFRVNAQYYNDPELYSIIHELLKTEYKDIGLVAVELHKPNVLKAYFIDTNGDTVEMDPPPPPPVSAPIYFFYSKIMFLNMYNDGQLDSIEAENMFQRLDSLQNYELDPSQIIQKTFHFQTINNAFKSRGFQKGYHYMDKKYSKIGFLKLSTPVFNIDRDKVLISISAFKNGSWIAVTYLFRKFNNKWNIVYSQNEN
jgi:hypothetical protein